MAKKKTTKTKSPGKKKKSVAAAKKKAPAKKRKSPTAKKKKKSPARKSSKKSSKKWLNLGWLTGTTGMFAAIATAGVIGLMTLDFTSTHRGTGSNSALTVEFNKARQYKLGDRVAFWSSQLLKQNVRQNKLAELMESRSVPDSAPLIPKKFNCTTFVETVAALARSEQPDEVFDKLLEIRYKDSDPTFFHRNHFPEADWIPNNVKAGVLEDVTARIARKAGIDVAYESKLIKKGEWLKSLASRGKVSRSLASNAQDSWGRNVQVKLPYLPIGKITDYYDDLPQGAILNLVRKDSKSRPVLITHQGVIVKKGDKVFFRHSTPSGFLKTVPLPDYLVNVARRSPSLIGININVLKS